MPQYLNLTIPSACHEAWDKMTVAEQGRFCNSCQKVVVDFTSMSDAEVIRYFENYKGNTCGRFTSDQLERDLTYPKQQIPWLKYLLTISIPAFLLSLKGNAQSLKPSTKVEIIRDKSAAVPIDSNKKIGLISGLVLDENNRPLEGASVWFKGTGVGKATERDGRFYFKDVSVNTTLCISHVGYPPQYFPVTDSTKELTIKFTSRTTPEMSSTVVVMSGMVVPRRYRGRKKERKKQQEVKVEGSVKAFPNPVASGSTLNIQCQGLESGKYVLEIRTLSGQPVQTGTVNFHKEDNKMSLLVADLLPATYILRVVEEKTGKQYTQQVIVQK